MKRSIPFLEHTKEVDLDEIWSSCELGVLDIDVTPEPAGDEEAYDFDLVSDLGVKELDADEPFLALDVVLIIGINLPRLHCNDDLSEVVRIKIPGCVDDSIDFILFTELDSSFGFRRSQIVGCVPYDSCSLAVVSFSMTILLCCFLEVSPRCKPSRLSF